MSPTNNQTFTAPAKIQVIVSHSPSWPVLFEFQWRSNAQGTWTDVQGILLDNKKTSSGITGGEFNTSKTGQWRIRAIHNYPNTPYSVWMQVNVDEVHLGPKTPLTTRVPGNIPVPAPPRDDGEKNDDWGRDDLHVDYPGPFVMRRNSAARKRISTSRTPSATKSCRHEAPQITYLREPSAGAGIAR
jgi:hypothetical protein